MREVDTELKALRLHGMASAWADLVAQGTLSSVESSRWLIEHLLQAETTHRVMRSVSYQMSAAKFPAHRDLAGFDFASSKVDRALIEQLADLSFTEGAHNAVSSAGRALEKRIWPPPSVWPASLVTANGCAFIRPWTWSMRWSARKRRARPDALL